MKTSAFIKIGLIVVATLIFGSVANSYLYAAEENLDEMFARKARRATATWSASYFENPTTYIWQPETLMYKDVTSDHEVWKMSNTPLLDSVYQRDIGVSPWSADGKKMVLLLSSRVDLAYDQARQQLPYEPAYNIWFTVNTNGKSMRPTVEAAKRHAHDFFHWSAQNPSLYYETGVGPYLGAAGSQGTLYRTIVAEDGVCSTLAVLRLPSYATSCIINKKISANARKLIIESEYNSPFYYPISILSNGGGRLDDPDGYSIDRQFGLYGDTTYYIEPGQQPVTNHRDQYLTGTGDWYFARPYWGDVWWRIKTTGSATDGGALYTGDDGSHDFGEVWPESHGGIQWILMLSNITGVFQDWEEVSFSPSGAMARCWAPDATGKMEIRIHDYLEERPQIGDTITGMSSGATARLNSIPRLNLQSPWVQADSYNPDKTAYWDYFVPDRWGRHALFSNSASGLPNGVGPAIWDILDHHYVVASFGGGAEQNDWHGFCDWTVSSGGPFVNYAATLVNAQKYDDPNSQILVCNAHTRYDGGFENDSMIYPGQSPDGTKVSWTSEYLNGINAIDVYWSVVYYPYPPTTLTAATSNGVKISFLPPKYTERRWINPATGQIDEVNGEELFAREIKQYHLWRSTDQTTGWQEIGVIPAEYANDQATNTLKPRANGNWVSSSNKPFFTDNPKDGIYYYAVTSEEHSGLESDQLSEILQVTVSSRQVTSSGVVAPKGQKDFWRTPPAHPSHLTYQATGTQGHYRLNWTEASDSKVRYYNIYYSTQPNPQAIQQNRIASLPKGTNTYLDWLADPSQAGYYGITSVDRYGNESTIADTAKHITAANLDAGAEDELVIDFGQYGIWVYSTTSNSWNTLHPISSSSIIKASLDDNTIDDLAIDFGQDGIWVYFNNNTWVEIHDINPQSIIRADLDSDPKDELVVDFGQYGIWVYSNNSIWTKLHTLDPKSITKAKLDSDTLDELVIDFGQEGIWVYYSNSRTWNKIHSLTSDQIISADIDNDANNLDDLVIDFGTNGIWRYYNNNTWSQLHALSPDSITKANLDSDPKDDLVIDFGQYGIWIYYNNYIWVRVHTVNPESITRANLDSDTRDDLVIDFGTNGIWVYYNNNTWVKIHE